MTQWQQIETAPKDGTIVDVYVWGLTEVGLDDGFRWCEVKVVSPILIEVWHESDPADGDGYWREYQLSENVQYMSHWMPQPTPPPCDEPVMVAPATA